jgi:NAD(P)H-hydrate repair Nnr-like enzyme with NAD(P)H-hydrate dehydratase domain
MAKLTGEDADTVRSHAASLASDVARASEVIVVLKGPTTHIAHPDGRLWVHRGGGAGLGTSGSGDVLAGIIGGLAARGAAPEQAAVWGVALHARAGARLARRIGTLGFLAREIAGEIPALLDALGPRRRGE